METLVMCERKSSRQMVKMITGSNQSNLQGTSLRFWYSTGFPHPQSRPNLLIFIRNTTDKNGKFILLWETYGTTTINSSATSSN